MPRTANEILRDLGIRHAVYFQRLKTSEVNRVIGFLDREVLPEIARMHATRLRAVEARGYDTGTWTTQRLAEIDVATRGILRGAMTSVAKSTEGSLEDIAQHEADWQIRALQEAHPLDINFRSPSLETLRTLATSSPFEGKTLRGWFDRLAADAQQSISGAVRTGLGLGKTVDEIVNGLRGVEGQFGSPFRYLRRGAESVVRTAATHVSAETRQSTYEANADVIKGWQFVATLDARTTKVCMVNDGKEHALEDQEGKPPLHFACRSTTVPVLKSWEELGISAKEIPEGSRAALDGHVAESVTYPTWLKNQPEAIQNDVLGPELAGMFRNGTPIEKFIDDKGRPLSIREIRGIEVPPPPVVPPPPKPPPPAQIADLFPPIPPPVAPAAAPPEVALEPAPPRLAPRGSDVVDTLRASLAESEPQAAELRRALEEARARVVQIVQTDFDVKSPARIAAYDRLDEATAAHQRMVETRRSIIHSALKVEDPAQIRPKFLDPLGRPLEPKDRKRYADVIERGGRATQFLSSITSSRAIPSLDVAVRISPTAGRAAREFYSQTGHAVQVYTKTRTDTIVHEFGHAIEDRVPTTHKRAREFLARRAASDPAGERHVGPGYGRDETAFHDDFIEPYMGRKYSGWGTEITSMGVEFLYRDPDALLRRDPDYFAFIVDQLRGHWGP